MCGIVGVISKYQNGFFKQTEDSFFQMLYADALRGEDSTGIIAVENNSRFHIAKSTDSAEWFITQFKHEQDSIVRDMFRCGKVYIGHNRKKTMGAISDDTAHPFTVKNKFALVHNGTLYQHEKLANTAVDSEALAIHLQKHLQEAGSSMGKVISGLEEALGDVYGAYACAMYDQENHRVHLIRNKERPLSMIEVDNAWYFMSEALMGYWVLNRNNYEYSKIKAEAILEHQLVTFHLDEGKVTKEMLTPKKSFTPTQTTQTQESGTCHRGSTTVSARATTAQAGAGKFMQGGKDFKQFRKNFIFKRVSFWAEDYVEEDYPNTVAKGSTKIMLMGKLDEVGWAHDVYASIDMAALGLRYEEDLYNNKWSGVVEEIELNKHGYLRLIIQPGCKPMKPSINLKDLDGAKKFKAAIQKMTLEELHVLQESVKYSTKDVWKMTAINQDLAFRGGIQSIADAMSRAKSMEPDNVLKQVQRDNKLIYLTEGPSGRIYYETAVALH